MGYARSQGGYSAAMSDDQSKVSIDGGPWQATTLVRSSRHHDSSSDVAWRFWTYQWGTPAPGEHTVTSRAIAADGEVQPAPTDPLIADKRTYWESNGQVTRRVRVG